jgi:RimJ/RimL family protein N-acetyltransferase
MKQETNAFGQTVGVALPHWFACAMPVKTVLAGRYCRLEPLCAERHARQLYEAEHHSEDADWTYTQYGPFPSYAGYHEWLAPLEHKNDPVFFAIIDEARNAAMGISAYQAVRAGVGVLECGHVKFSSALQRTRAATEAMYLMMSNAFDLGYRRYEWKCDSLNLRSRKAAERLGFTLEGIFRQATIQQGRNRDTAWYSILDSEWPALQVAFETWLDPSNFDAQGLQLHSLSSIRAGRGA